jgi:hypothetical protein
MIRIIADSYMKENPQLYTVRPDDLRGQEANREILAVNAMYGWLYREGFLRQVSFEIRDYPEVTHFAFDTKDLEPYRAAMENSGVKDADLSVRLIFDEKYTPCIYSGAIELTWSMKTYRSNSGCVSSSWECAFVRWLNTEGADEVSAVQREKGSRAAISKAFELLKFKPDLLSQVGEAS